MKLILVRHGQSARNAGYEILDEENSLTIKGVKQAVEAGAVLAPKKIDAIYCSPAKRCIQTLDEILRVRDDNFAIHLTRLLGPKFKKENYEKIKARVELFLDDLKYDHKKTETVVIVSHHVSLEMMILILTGKTKKLENGELFEIVLVVETK
ncbi:MAG: phosphoglycerate mutase family protein [Candidatus Shapirobacteria bacterium]|nr:phosphoglycerate mutase family protein [Candidatus Shapirobacteria bacterium]